MYKATYRFVFLIPVLALVLSACGSQSGPQATQVPAAGPAATELSAPTEPLVNVPTATQAVIVEGAPTLEVIDLGGPVMEIGATYPYVDGSTLVAVPGGEFIMGYGNEDNLEHRVTLGGFWIYRNEVTNGQYALCVTLGKCSPPDTNANTNFLKPLRRNDPVNGVSWDQAQAYCQFVNGRLPTEAEWEKTARGPNGNIYPWGDAAASCDLANIGRCNPETTAVTAHPKGASFYGAVDLSGNVFEWVGDWFSSQYYHTSPAENPLGPETGVYRSVRSTAFHSDFYLAEAARRFRELPVKQRDDLGFRCVVEDPSLFAPWCEIVTVVNPDQSGGGPAEANIPVPDCPPVSVSSGGFCNQNFNPPEPGATLNFGPDPLPAGVLTSYPAGCVPDLGTADPSDFYCAGSSGEGMASIKALCTVPPPPVPASCAPGYTQNGNLCEYTGGLPGRQCLPGINYDPITQCCGSIPGGTDVYTLCPVDAPYYAGGICQPWPMEDYGPLQTIAVGLGSCEPNEQNGCEPPPFGCGGPNSPTPCWDPKTCSCVPVDPRTGKCP